MNNKVKIWCNMIAVGDTVEEALERTINQLKDMLDASNDATIASDYHRWNMMNEGEVDWIPYQTKFAKNGSRVGRAVTRAFMRIKNGEDSVCKF